MKETIQRDTPVDLFNNILKTARNAGALQELDRIIDYDSACEFMEENRKPISHYEFSTVFSVDFGGSEGALKAFTSMPGFMDIWTSPGIRNGFVSARSKRWKAA